ncbi:MAG TPA: BamA/TamA family outer membrane protein, partial [Adhaeribacter sp.]|nr:BamA/TamA family outer membrane protein [Adhaeribacter sp.]
NRQVDVYMRLKEDAPEKALRPYTIDDVYVFARFSLADSLYNADTIRFENYHYIPDENYVRARHLMPSIFLEKGRLYARQDHLLTIRRLMGLGAYKYANIDYAEDTLNAGKLDAFIYVTPALKKSLRLEAQMVTKSNNLAGPGLTASFRNRNAFKGSELLTLNLIANYENQIGGQAKESRTPLGLSSYELGVRTDLTLPRFITPFKVNNLRSESVPHTRISLGYSYLSRVEFFTMNSYTGSYSYNWKPRKTVTYEVTPVNLQFVRLANTTPAFDSVLQANQFLRRSFEQQFILGSIFQHTYDTRVYENRTSNFFNRFNIDLSGNVANAFKTLIGADAPDDDNPRSIVGQPFSQYTRVENDFRYYFNLSKESVIATRFIAGAGFAYGNSSTLPYVKQFTIGGPNSIRAFRARSIGPGSYDIPDDLAFSYFDQTGDMKLEANIEYRFPISGWFKGALFVDAGNIWLLEESESRPGGEFKASRFMNELAVGTGFGLRVDVEFFVIRFDFGIPVRIPSDSNDQQNVLPEFRPGLGENGMILNIAIGYPF